MPIVSENEKLSLISIVAGQTLNDPVVMSGTVCGPCIFTATVSFIDPPANAPQRIDDLDWTYSEKDPDGDGAVVPYG